MSATPHRTWFDASRSARRALPALGAALLVLIEPGAWAQNALGDGNALGGAGHRTGTGSGGRKGTGAKAENNAIRSSVQDQARLNDAIVTGNVSGGKEFRGSLGYTGADDFRGRTASDSTFRFERNAYNGAVAAGATGVRGIDAIQQQFARTGANGGGAVALRRTTSGATAADISSDPDSSLKRGVSPYNTSAGALRSTGKFVTDRAASSSLVNTMVTAEDGSRLSASPLRGVFVTNVPGSAADLAARAAALTEQRNARPGATQTTKVSDAAEPAPDETKIEPDSTFQNLVKDLAKGRKGNARENPEPTTEPEPKEPAAQQTMIKTPAPTEQGKAGEPGKLPGAPDAGAPALPGAPDAARQGAKPEAESDAATSDDQRTAFDNKLRALRARLISGGEEADKKSAREAKRIAESDDTPAGKKRAAEAAADEARSPGADAKDLFGDQRPFVSKFVDPQKDPGAFERHVTHGQDFLAQGKWFDAEDAFTRAMAIRPDEPLPAIGRTHAQLGAGMFLSAAANLRAALRDHPELAAMKYDAALFPKGDRVGAVVASLREAAANRQDTYGRDSGLLLAYVGNQTGSKEDVEAGLAAIERVEERLQTPHDPLVDVLRGLWLP